MSDNKKYHYNIEQQGSTWTAQILRHITSKKTVVSKQQEGFSNEPEAKVWAEQQLSEFLSTLVSSNQRHGQQRKLTEEGLEQRSSRRAEKTKKAKLEKLEKEREDTMADSATDSMLDWTENSES